VKVESKNGDVGEKERIVSKENDAEDNGGYQNSS
jgi:hypothetical protein